MQPIQERPPAAGSPDQRPPLAAPALDATTLTFTSETDLQALAQEYGYRYERSRDGREESVIRDDGTVVIHTFRVPPELRRAKRKQPSVWLRSIRYHTYLGKPQDEGDIYLAHDDQVENILNLKFAVLDTPPAKATR